MKRRVFILVLSLIGMILSSVASPAHAASSDPVPSGWPQLLSIPRIGVQAPVESLALNGSTDFRAPYRWGDVVWYDRGPRPGDPGRADIFGHLDSFCCPAIFYHLRDLHKGDRVYVVYKSGQVLTFQVLWQAQYLNQRLPLNWMFGRTSDRGITLITCSGVFHRNGIGYDHKLIVYATLVWPKHH